MSRAKSAALIVCIPLALLAIPVSVETGDHGVRVSENTCAADGTCCPEWLSICGLNGKNYENMYLKPQGGSCYDPG